MAVLTPWWNVTKLRSEILDSGGTIDDVQMSLFNAVYGAAGIRPAYADADYFGEITHPSQNLVELMARVAVRLGGGANYAKVPALWRLDQAMGGGKSHGLIGLWHLASHPAELHLTDIGRVAFETAAHIAGAKVSPDLGNPQVVVLACDNMTAGQGDPAFDGPAVTLHERFIWRLFGGDRALYNRYQPHFGDKNKIAEALTAVDRPVLILADEIMDYIRQLSVSSHGDLATRDMAFLRALLDAVNDVPRVSMVVVMIASDQDTMALDVGGIERRQEIESLLVRNARPATVTSNTDFAAILRRRLFEAPPPAEVIESTRDAFRTAMAGGWTKKVFEHLPRMSPGEFDAEVERCYPFHPLLLHIAENEWAPLVGFQKVRSTIRIFAAAAYIQSVRGKAGDWAPLLIGPGDLPLSASEVREAVIGSGLIADEKTQANYRQLASTDIVSDDDQGGAGRRLDMTREGVMFTVANPRAAERMATSLFVYSIIGPRSQGRQGATEVELRAASFVPDASYGVPDADVVLQELGDPDTGLAALERIEGKGGQPARLYLSTRQTLNMLFRAARASIQDDERDDEFARIAENLANSGPFKTVKFVAAKAEDQDSRTSREILENAGIDDARSTRLVILDPRRFSFLNGVDRDTREAIRAAMGIGDKRLPMQWAPSAVFVIANTQRRKVARAAIADYLAWSRVVGNDAVRQDNDLREQAQEALANARRSMHDAARRAYQHIVYLAPSENGDGREDREIRLEAENQSALDGTIVWKKLVEVERAFDVGEFDGPALLHNLSEGDYAKPLDEVRDSFWNTARLPLLPGGELDLKRAIFEALQSGELRLVGDDGEVRSASTASEIGIGSTSQRLAPKEPEAAKPEPETQPEPEPGAGDTNYPEPTPEVQLGITLTAGLNDSARREAVYQLLQELTLAVDNQEVTHVQMSLKAVMPEKKAQSLASKGDKAGGTTNTTPMS
jgi:hypothetical protein